MNFYRESDIEKAFCEYIEEEQKSITVLGRQVRLPYGIVDILAREDNGRGETRPVVIEIKKGKIDLEACGQVLSYVEQIRHLVGERLFGDCSRNGNWEPMRAVGCNPNAILVGSSITKESERFENSMGCGSNNLVFFYTYKFENGAFTFDDCGRDQQRPHKHDQRLENLISSIVAYHAEG